MVPCEGLTRTPSNWEALGNLPWVPTSPHVPRPESSHFYAATGIIGELSTLSIGVGYPLPFELAGAPGVGPVSLARELERRSAVLPGMSFRPASWTPFYGAQKRENCGGVQVYLTDTNRAPLTRLNFELLDALRTLGKRSLFNGSEESRMFDLSCGTNRVRQAFLSGANARELWGIFNENLPAFMTARKRYLLYPER